MPSFNIQQRPIFIPVKMRARVCFPAWCNIAVANYVILFDRWVQCLNASRSSSQHFILLIGKTRFVTALEFDSDGKIVTFLPIPEAGNSRMPGSLFQRYKLKQCAIAADKHMGRDLQVRDFLEIRMSQGIQLIQEQILNPGATEFTWWKADIVDDQQANFSTRWTLVLVW